MQYFGMTKKEHYGMLWYLLELANYYEPMVYYVRGGRGFSKRLDFGESILKMHRI